MKDMPNYLHLENLQITTVDKVYQIYEGRLMVPKVSLMVPRGPTIRPWSLSISEDVLGKYC
jgi:hypothetical protein